MSEPRRTRAAALFGTSTPTSDLPGIGASIRIGCAASAIARSWFSAVIRESFTPSAGFSVYLVTAGPMLISPISTGIPKLSSVRLIMFAFARRSPVVGFSPADFKREIGGGLELANFCKGDFKRSQDQAKFASLPRGGYFDKGKDRED